MAESVTSGSLELRVWFQLREQCHKEIFTCRTPGTPQQSGRCSANRALTLPSQLRVSVSQSINTAVQRRTQTAVNCYQKVMIQTPLQNQQGDGLIEAKKPDLLAHISLLFSISYSDTFISGNGWLWHFCIFLLCFYDLYIQKQFSVRFMITLLNA